MIHEQRQCAQCGCGRPTKDMKLVCCDCIERARRLHKMLATMEQHHKILVTGLQDEIDRLNAVVAELTRKLEAPEPKEDGDNNA